jgi:hypothetical protein
LSKNLLVTCSTSNASLWRFWISNADIRAMCYTRRDQRFDEEAYRLRAEEDRRRRKDSGRHSSEERHQEKPLTEKVKEMVGAR